MALTLEYTQLVFSLAGMVVEDVEKVYFAVKLFIENGQVPADKNLRISKNKKLRNAELYQFAKNITEYNLRDDLDIGTFLKTTFEEWFT